ncbi:hypothetical protein V1514DRAFT_108418 [Lipomyces japonicus]|uniref:uncharacterized protein n=1 Tax=Lipomyces japonicus TaxID=56871 RepID=UPI0034CEFC51
MADSEAAIIHDRITINEANFRRIAKHVQKIPSLVYTDNDQISNSLKDFQDELAVYENQITKSQLQKNVAEQELGSYESQKVHINETREQNIKVTSNLERELEQARIRRTHLEEYDQFAKNLKKEKLESRQVQLEAIEGLENDIRDLEVQKEEFAKVWLSRRDQFQAIVEALQGMQRQIREEKEEQDRIEGMDETEEGEIDESKPTGETSGPGVTSASETPVPSETQEENPSASTTASKQDKMDLS